MSDRPKYLAIDGRVPSIVSLCSKKDCNRYHDWMTFNSSESYYDVERIAKAMSLMDAPKTELKVRDNPPTPEDADLQDWYSLAGQGNAGLRAVWRAGYDVGMETP